MPREHDDMSLEALRSYVGRLYDDMVHGDACAAELFDKAVQELIEREENAKINAHSSQ